MKKHLKLTLICSLSISCLPITCISIVSCKKEKRLMYIVNKNGQRWKELKYKVDERDYLACWDAKTFDFVDNVRWYSINGSIAHIDMLTGYLIAMGVGETYIAAECDGYNPTSIHVIVQAK